MCRFIFLHLMSHAILHTTPCYQEARTSVLVTDEAGYKSLLGPIGRFSSAKDPQQSGHDRLHVFFNLANVTRLHHGAVLSHIIQETFQKTIESFQLRKDEITDKLVGFLIVQDKST